MQHKKSLTSEWKCDHHPDQVGKREIAPNDITSVNGVSAAYNQTLYEEMTAVQLNRDAGVPGGGGRKVRTVYEEDYNVLLAKSNTFIDTRL